MKATGWPAGWLTVLAAAAVVAVNAAGIWGIAVANRGAREEEARLFAAETASRARALESLLSATRAELAFLAGSSAISGLSPEPTLARAREVEWRRLAAEAALLVFLRGHPEVKRLIVKSGKDHVLVETARRGGVPVLWMPQDRSTTEAPDTGRRPAVRAVFAFDPGRPVPDMVRVVAEIDVPVLLDHGAPPDGATSCALRDGSGRTLASAWGAKDVPPATARGRPFAEAPTRADGWSVPSPWVLSCVRERGAASVLEPVAARSRTLLVLNLAIMALAVLLGSFAIREARRRERLEAVAQEEARVRDLERQLFHAERLGTVGRLAAGMAHEINNPLEGIANYLALAKDHLAHGDMQGASKHLDGVRQGLERAAGIVRRVLAHAEPTSAPHAPVDLSASVRETVEFVRSRREFRTISFAADAPGPLMTPGNAVMLGQVLLNLVINASEAQPGGGEVRVSAAREGDEVVVRIADRGPGVAEAERTRIFEPFYTTKQQSTGLGLSVCHSIVAQHRGQLSVDAREGGGAVFTLRLPALAEERHLHAV
jgi:signal transduction histidine kinase